MWTYIVLNSIFVAAVVVGLLLLRTLVWNKIAASVLGVLLVLTAIFDSLIIAFGIVDYDETRLLGISIWRAPIEDFFYTVLVVILVPSLWKYFGRSKQ